MLTKKLTNLVVGLGLIASAGFAGERYLALSAVEEEVETALGQLREAQELARKHSEAFGAGAKVGGGEAGLKGLVQTASQKNGVSIAFLNENEKEAGKGLRDKQVTARVVNASHSNLVMFLAQIEAEGNGAKVREIRLRPSKDDSSRYEEAEVVIGRRVTAAASGQSEK